MIEVGEFIHYSTIALTMGISSIGVGIGEGMTSGAALDAINKQPAARDDIAKAAILGMALIETAAIMGLSMATILLRGEPVSSYGYCAELGVMLAVCFSSLTIGLLSALPTREACHAIARQPFFSQKILRFMLLTQSILQTPIIFGFIVAVMIKNQATTIQTFEESLKLIAAGLCIGLGSIGPAIGLARFAKTACRGIGFNREAYNKLFSFMLISEAMIETPIIFSLIISMLILLAPLPAVGALTKSIALFAAALCTGLGTFGPGISSGKTSSAACEQIALNPDQYETLSKISVFGQGLIDTSAIYALLISLWLIYWF
jgi:F0F1-type ATP synthase membrane subunit c/vacuolar-type H+-ATPase subunit K